MGTKAAHRYLVGGILALVGYKLLQPLHGSSLLFELVGISPAVAIGLGIRWHRPQPILPWGLFVAAQVSVVVGDVVHHAYDLPFPSLSDVFYIASYLLQGAGLLLLIKSRTGGRNAASLLDAVIAATGIGLLSWIYLLNPHDSQIGLGQAERILALAYPAMDLLLLAIAARLVMGTSTRPVAYKLMMAGVVCLTLTDLAYGAIQLKGTYTSGGVVDLGWMVACLFWGAAALHPSMTELSARTPTTRVPLTAMHTVVLAVSTLVAPALILIDSRWPIYDFDVPGVAGASALVFVLLILRLQGLVFSERQAVGKYRRAARREQTLRLAATALAAASDPESVRRATVGGAQDLVQGLRGIHVAVHIGDGQAAGSPPVRSDAIVIPMSTQAAVYGHLAVTGAETVSVDLVEGLHTLGAQAALALEAAAFNERFVEQRREAWVGALVQNSSDVIMVLDADLVIRYVTPSVQVVLGHRPVDLVGDSLLGLVESEGEAVVTAFFSAAEYRAGTSGRAVWRMRCGDGSCTDVEVVSTDQLGNPSINGIVVTARDITERKALESGLERQVKELEELDRIRTEFVATVSHELRTPLTNIVGEVELLADGDLGELLERQKHGVEVIGRNSQRLKDLIDDLLTLSHVETSELQLHCAPTPVTALVDDVRLQVGSKAAAKHVELALDCCPQAGTAFVDREQMGRALLNLLTNAVKFTPPGGSVDLRARREGDNLVVTVADTGMGIPLDEQARLFTRFFRSTNATRLAIQGSGLGLVIVKKIVEEHGGTISIASVPEIGTTVTVKVPAEESPMPTADAA